MVDLCPWKLSALYVFLFLTRLLVSSAIFSYHRFKLLNQFAHAVSFNRVSLHAWCASLYAQTRFSSAVRHRKREPPCAQSRPLFPCCGLLLFFYDAWRHSLFILSAPRHAHPVLAVTRSEWTFLLFGDYHHPNQYHLPTKTSFWLHTQQYPTCPRCWRSKHFVSISSSPQFSPDHSEKTWFNFILKEMAEKKPEAGSPDKSLEPEEAVKLLNQGNDSVSWDGEISFGFLGCLSLSRFCMAQLVVWETVVWTLLSLIFQIINKLDCSLPTSRISLLSWEPSFDFEVVRPLFACLSPPLSPAAFSKLANEKR